MNRRKKMIQKKLLALCLLAALLPVSTPTNQATVFAKAAEHSDGIRSAISLADREAEETTETEITQEETEESSAEAKTEESSVEAETEENPDESSAEAETEETTQEESTGESIPETEHITHIYDDGVIITPATCLLEGVITYTCTVCGYTTQETLPVSDHSYENYYCIWCDHYGGLEAPVMKKIENVLAGVKVTWYSVENAYAYRVFRKGTEDTDWTVSYDVAAGSEAYVSFSDSDVESGAAYTYSVICIDEQEEICSPISETSLSITHLKALTSSDLTTSNTISGAKVTFPAVAGAESYNVYRKTGASGSYAKLTTISESNKASYSYTDATAESGTTYYYCVRSVNGSTMASYSGKSLTYLKAIVSADLATANTIAGARVTFPAVSGATSYNVYRKTGSGGSYKKVGTVTESGDESYSFTDSTAESGNNYYYCVRAAKGSAMGSYSGKALYYLKAIIKTDLTLSNVTTGIAVKWPKITGAEGYYVYRKTGSDSYTKIKTVTSGSTVSYIDTAVKSNTGTSYTYCVRPYYGSTSGSHSGQSIVRLATPGIPTVTNVSTLSASVSFTKSSTATGYQIMYSTSLSFASGNKTVSTTESGKTISGLTKGTTYYVRIRAYKTSGTTTYYSAWSGARSVTISK